MISGKAGMAHYRLQWGMESRITEWIQTQAGLRQDIRKYAH